MPDDEGGYEMISGHRRLYAVNKIGLPTILANIKLQLFCGAIHFIMKKEGNSMEFILAGK